MGIKVQIILWYLERIEFANFGRIIGDFYSKSQFRFRLLLLDNREVKGNIGLIIETILENGLAPN